MAWMNYKGISGNWPGQQGAEQPYASQWSPQVDPTMGQHWPPMVYPSQWAPGAYYPDHYGHCSGNPYPVASAGYPPFPPGAPPEVVACSGNPYPVASAAYPPLPPGAPPELLQPYPQQAEQPGLENPPREGGIRETDEEKEAYADEASDNEDEASDNEQAANVDADGEDHAMAVYCIECQTWLNGPRQYDDHKIGKKHKKNVQKAKRGNASGSSAVVQPVEQKEPTPDVVPEKKTDMWQWLEDGKAAKEAEEHEKKAEGGTGEEKTSRSARRRRHKKEKEEREAAEAAEAAQAAALEAAEDGVAEAEIVEATEAAQAAAPEAAEDDVTEAEIAEATEAAQAAAPEAAEGDVTEAQIVKSEEKKVDLADPGVAENTDLTVPDKAKLPENVKVVPPRDPDDFITKNNRRSWRGYVRQ